MATANKNINKTNATKVLKTMFSAMKTPMTELYMRSTLNQKEFSKLMHKVMDDYLLEEIEW